MPVSIEFLRGVLGVLGVLFAHFLGRTIVKVQKGKARKRALYTWALRFILSVVAVCYLAVDRLAIIVLVLDAVAFGSGGGMNGVQSTRKILPGRCFRMIN